jgi:hypothetical protein
MAALRAACGTSLSRMELSSRTSTSSASGRSSGCPRRTTRQASTRRVVVRAVASSPWIGDWAARESDGLTTYDGPPLRWFNEPEPSETTHGGTPQTYASIGDWAAETMASYGGPPLRWFNDTYTGSGLSSPSAVAASASSEWIADWAAGYIGEPPSQQLLEPPPSEPLEGALPLPGRVHQVRVPQHLQMRSLRPNTMAQASSTRLRCH